VDAISSFKERIIPLLTTLEESQRRVQELENQQSGFHRNKEQLRSQRLRIEELETARHNLRLEQLHAQGLANKAVASAEEATNKVVVLRRENQELQDEREAVLKHLEKEKEKDQELKKYKGFCDDYKKKVRQLVWPLCMPSLSYVFRKL
jgi:DNA repair exonuclease SbcCD ATPase subunit